MDEKGCPEYASEGCKTYTLPIHNQHFKKTDLVVTMWSGRYACKQKSHEGKLDRSLEGISLATPGKELVKRQ